MHDAWCIIVSCNMLMYTNVHKQVFHFLYLFFFLLTISYHPPSWYLTSHYIIWCNIISYQYSSDLFANYASTSSYRWVSYVMFTCWLSCSYRYTPYLTYMCTRWLSFRWLPFSYRFISYICSLVDCRFPIYTSRIFILTCWLSCSYWCTRMHMRTRWLSFPIDASRMYMLKRWLYCVYNLFSNTHRLILMWTYIHAKRNVLVMI